MTALTPLEPWIREKARISPTLTDSAFTKALEAYHLSRINEFVDYARRNTAFYRNHLAFMDGPIKSLSDIGMIPFTKPSDLSRNPFGFLAVRQDEVARIVTLRTSGSMGEAKRLFFTDADLELTIDFFHHGMSTLVQPGQRVAVLLPGEKPDSVGDLLRRGLLRMNIDILPYGPITDPVHAARTIASFGADCLVGIPTQVLAMAQSGKNHGMDMSSMKNILLSTDYVPKAIKDTLQEIWGCRVFNHYGMTEMGLGGGVDCEALGGYHLREADLYFEVVNHETGETCPDGTIGEVVFTTLTRQGMPLIRYRTGDIARMIPSPCPCGSALRRMEWVRGRWDSIIPLSPGCILTLPDMDEALFGLPGLLDYRITVSRRGGRRLRLHVDVYRAEDRGPTDRQVIQCLNELDVIQRSMSNGDIEAPTVCFSSDGHWTTTGTSKRKIINNDMSSDEKR
jgi:phenylacetate-CoA ligase